MLSRQVFNIIRVNNGKGAGTEVTEKPDKKIIYTGEKEKMKL